MVCDAIDCFWGDCYTSKHGKISNHGEVMAKLTKTAVDALQPKQRGDGALADAYLWDGETKGFGCKCTPAGKKVYIFQFRAGGREAKTQRLTLGAHGSITCDQARELARRHVGAKASGRDPAQEQRDERRKKASAITFAECCELYLASNGGDKRSWDETRRLLEYDAVRAWGSRPMSSITEEDAMKLIEAVKARAPYAARALFLQLRPLFKWAKPLGYIPINPMADLEAPPPPKARDRVLEDAEIGAFWKGCEQLGWPFGPCFQLLLLLTGQREDEVAAMEQSEFDRAMAFWRLPGGKSKRTKNGLGHLVDLSPQASRLLSGLPRPACQDGRSYLFTTTGRKPISGFSNAKTRLDGFMCADLNEKVWTEFLDAGGRYDISRPLTDEIRERRDAAAQSLGFSDAATLQASILGPLSNEMR